MSGEEKISAAESIVGVMRLVRAVGKDGRNERQNFNFRGIDGVVNAVGPALREVGGFFVPKVLELEYEHGLTNNGGACLDAHVKVKYSWFGTDGGEPVTSVVVAEARDTSDKATAKAMSVAERTYLIQILCLPTDSPDPDEDYEELAAPGTRPQEQPKPAARGRRKPAEPKQEPIAGAKTSVTRDWVGLGEACSTYDELKEVFNAAGELGERGLKVMHGMDEVTVDQYLRDRKRVLLAGADDPSLKPEGPQWAKPEPEPSEWTAQPGEGDE